MSNKRKRIVYGFFLIVALLSAGYLIVLKKVTHDPLITLLRSPPEVPWYLPELTLPPGTQFLYSDWNKNGVSHTLCFSTIKNAVLGSEIDVDRIPLGVDIDPGNTPGFDPFIELRLNESIIEGPKINPREEEIDICWFISDLPPGDYLAELKLEGLITKDFQWAFRVIDG